MTDKVGYIPRDDRKKILFISDSITGISGVANVARSLIAGTAHHYNFINIGVSQDPKVKGHAIDLCESVNKELGIGDSFVKTIQWDKYDDVDLIKKVMEAEKPDLLLFITDPRYFQGLFPISKEIQYGGANGKNTPMAYIQIWDEFTPPFYNRAAWSSVNMSLCISKQTKLMNEIVLGDRAEDIKLEYFPHGVDVTKFKPLDISDEKVIELKKSLFGDKTEVDFVLFFNSRNIYRKNIPTALMGFKAFIRKLSPEKASKCRFVLHTQPVDNNGTDLHAVIDSVFGPNKHLIVFDEKICSEEDLNLRYNLADATVLISEAEGFGLSGLESIAAGTPIIVNMTGGMQDYCNIKGDDGKWFTPNEKVWSNHNKTYEDMGSWVYPVFPASITTVGSVPTPYIFSSRCDFRDVGEQMMLVYNTEAMDREEAGFEGREWIMSEEVGMTTEQMCSNFIKHTDDLFENWQPIPRYNIVPLDGSEIVNYVEIPDYLFNKN
jgi:glycosyltransferase involved in cell wall biosynthesis